MGLVAIYKDVKEIYPSILKHRIPDSIFDDIKKCIKRTDKIRKHKLSFLLAHHLSPVSHAPGGSSYHISVPIDCLEGSFLQAYLIYLGEWYRCKYEKYNLDETRRTVRLRKNTNHFDSYDCWVNYTEKGTVTSMHNHAGNLSGVIYYTDYKNSPLYFENGFSYKAQKKDIVIFPSNLRHAIDKQKSKKRRITLAYNLYYC